MFELVLDREIKLTMREGKNSIAIELKLEENMKS